MGVRRPARRCLQSSGPERFWFGPGAGGGSRGQGRSGDAVANAC